MSIKILYVEDEPFLAKIVKESLQSREYEVKHIDHGEKALAGFESFNPDICVLDIMLPGMNGFEIAKQIREVNVTVPILFLTAKDQTEDVIEGFDSGGNDYIKKPFSMEELIVRIKNLLQLSQGKSNNTKSEITIGNQFKFYPQKMQLLHGEVSVSLSHKENKILELLCKHQNSTLNRKKLLLDVWNDDSYFNSRNLDVYIRKLRKYLAADDSVEIITLKGIGYRFRNE